MNKREALQTLGGYLADAEAEMNSEARKARCRFEDLECAMGVARMVPGGELDGSICGAMVAAACGVQVHNKARETYLVSVESYRRIYEAVKRGEMDSALDDVEVG